MNYFHKVHYASKRIRRNFKMQLLSIIIMAVVLTMIYLSLILLAGLAWGRTAVKNSLNVPLESCGMVKFTDNVSFKELNRFMERACALDEIGAFGYYSQLDHTGLASEGDTDYLQRLLEIQNEGKKEYEDWETTAGPYVIASSDEDVQEICMNRELFGMENIRLAEGNPPDMWDGDAALMYLGYDFREIPVGTVFVQDDHPSVRYEVAGILEQGSCLTDPVVLNRYNNNGLTLSYNVQMDKMVLFLWQEGYMSCALNLFCAADGYTYEDAVIALNRLGQEMGITMRTGTFSARVDTVFESNDIIRGRIDGAVSISCILLFMLCVTVQLLNIYTKRKELGVWIANGISRREMLGILWLENFIKAVVGAVTAAAAARVLLWRLCRIYQSERYHSALREAVSLMHGMPLAGLCCAALLLACAVSVIPVAVTMGKQTVDLVKGVWN